MIEAPLLSPNDIAHRKARERAIKKLVQLPDRGCGDVSLTAPSHLILHKLSGRVEFDSCWFWGWPGLLSIQTFYEQGKAIRLTHEDPTVLDLAASLMPGAQLSPRPAIADYAAEISNREPSNRTMLCVGPSPAMRETLWALVNELQAEAAGALFFWVCNDWDAEQGSTSLRFLDQEARFAELGLTATQQFLCLPSLERPELIINERFVSESAGSWRHIRKYLDEEGNPRSVAGGVSEACWESLEKTNSLPIQNAPRLTLYSREGDRDIVQPTDFVHQSIGGRRAAYWVELTKQAGQDFVERELLLRGSAEDLARIETLQPGLKHVEGREDYVSGPTLSDCWLREIRKDLTLVRIRTALEGYFRFIEEHHDAHQTINLDLIPDNIVVRSDGALIPIDQEWTIDRGQIDKDLLFLRGVVYFLNRNVLDLDAMVGFQEASGTYLDFLLAITKSVKTGIAQRLGDLENFERNLRAEVNASYSVLSVQSMLNRRFGERATVPISLGAEYSKPNHRFLSVLNLPRSVAQSGADVEFKLSAEGRMPTTIVFRFPKWMGKCVGGYFHLSSGSRRLGPGETALETVASGKIEPGSLAVSEDLDEITYSLPIHLMNPAPEIGELIINLRAFWPQLVYGEGSDEQLVNRLWGKEVEFQSLKDRVSILSAELEETTKELSSKVELIQLMKSSKAWRVAEALRKVIFFGLLGRGSTKSHPRAAIEVLNQPETKPAERLSLVSEMDQISKSSFAGNQERLKVSVVLPVHNTPKAWLADAIQSVRNQTYHHWQLIVIDDGSTLLETREYLDRLNDPRIKLIHLTSSSGISRATNFGFEAAEGEVIALMDHDDMLAPSALSYIAQAFQSGELDIVYSDETVFSDDTDQIREGWFGTPHLKPDYSPDLLLSHNYITHFLAFKRSLLLDVGGMRPEFDGAQDYDLLLRLTEKSERVGHISEPLYCWRQSRRSTSLDTGVKPEAHLRGKRALSEALARRGIEGEVLMANAPHFFRVRRQILGDPSVDIVIPFRDQPVLLEKCLTALLRVTRFENYRILCVDNGSVEELTREVRSRFSNQAKIIRFVDYDRPFNFAEINNFAVDQSDADHVVLMNNDIEVINADWLEAMIEHSQREEVGAVGAKLYYPNDTIQHAGIAIGIGDYAGHPHKHEQGGFRGYLNRLNVIQNVSAVTAALLMCRRQLFNEIGGLDSESFKVACNDVDFCLRLREKGYRNVFTPYAKAYHHESVSRGYEDTPEKRARFEAERKLFQDRHARALETGDPFYNKNLRRDTEDVLPINRQLC